MKTLFKILVFGSLGLQIGCGSPGYDAPMNNSQPTNYSMSNGVCYNNSGQQVSPTNCGLGSNPNNNGGTTNGTAGGYNSYSGVCYNGSGQTVAPIFCSTTGTTTGVNPTT